MRLPEIADALREIAESKKCHKKIAAKLVELAAEIRRRRPVKRGPVISARMTEKLAREIKYYALAHPDLTQIEVGRVFNVNPGRVSEVMRGKRK